MSLVVHSLAPLSNKSHLYNKSDTTYDVILQIILNNLLLPMGSLILMFLYEISIIHKKFLLILRNSLYTTFN